MYKSFYKTPDNFDDIILNSDGEYLTGLYFKGSKDASIYLEECIEVELPIFQETKKWLDIYFSGQNPNFTPKYKIKNLTSFREEVTHIMNTIPYGSTVTYKDITNEIAKSRVSKKMSAQAVGGAVGANPICIIIPCHRVIGINGNLTGYSGGIKNKIALLNLEKNELNQYFLKNIKE